MTPQFIHLNIHSEFALIDGIVRVKPLASACAKGQMPAVALTDQMNLFGLVKFYKACLAAGVKPIIGVSVYLANEKEPEKPFEAILLCQNEIGYRNLAELVSRGYLEGQHHGRVVLQRAWVVEQNAGLIMLSGAQKGDVGQALLAGNQTRAEKILQRWMEVFPNRYYFELQRLGRPHEEAYIRSAVELAQQHHLPVVATNAVRFIKQDDFDAHETRVAIHDGYTMIDPNRPRNYTRQQYLKTPAAMVELFADIPEAIENTVEIAKRCNVHLSLGEVFLPDFPVPKGMTIDNFLAEESRKGLELRLTKLFDVNAPEFADIRKPYDERLEIELGVINKMGFPGYFLIVADFIQWAKNNEIPVGPGRGSGAGSLVAYVLMITDLDPLKYELLFERFLNPERVSMPDFDVDFCMEGRDRVIEYVAQKYGREAVSQIITYGTMAAKAVIRDVGRVLGHPYGFVDALAKMIPFEIGITLDKALAQEETLRERYNNEEEVTNLLDLAKKLEGITRNVGKHAGGVVIAPSKLTDFVPIYCEEGEASIVSQFDKDDVESVGLVKFDFLGLRTLTIIDWALKNIKLAHNKSIDITTIPMDDSVAFDLLKDCNTTAVFQLESRGMKDLIKRLKPDSFEEIIALVALFRPGPLQSGMVDDFIDRKHGRAVIEYPHPDLEVILRPTYGVILYQEQVMQIAQVLANYTLGGADVLRRAMGKKKPEEMVKQRLIFVDGATKRGVDKHTSTRIFDLMEKFAGYGFNKSHSAAYALLSYQTAWLKAHYPAEFMAAVMSADMDNTDKVVIMVEDSRAMKVKVIPPCINAGDYKFTVNKTGDIVYGLGAIKGMGEAAIEGIVEERKQNGAYQNIFEFCQRVDLRKVNRRVLEALIKSGAMDCFEKPRAVLCASVEKALKQAEQHSRNEAIGQDDLFGGGSHEVRAEYVEVKPWSEKERLAGEKVTLGLYITGHPLARYADEFKHFTTSKIVELRPTRNQTVTVAGIVMTIRTMITKRGDRMAFMSVDDGTGRMEMAVFSDVFNDVRELLIKDNLLVIEGEVSMDDYTGGYKMSATKIWSLDQARERFARGIVLTVDADQASNDIITELQRRMLPYKQGNCPVYIDYQNGASSAQFNMSAEWKMQPCDDLLDSLEEVLGDKRTQVIY
tara:strand:- start:45334 stop:48774 length:3441 start_codon:yes stop_codon:yes gene_type:complete